MLNETITITLDVAANDALLLEHGGQFNPLHLMFVDSASGDTSCWLCFIDWLLKLLGFDTTFWQLHHLELTEIRNTPTWDYYQSGFAQHAEEISLVVAANPTLLWQTADALETWTPALQAYDDGTGSAVFITQPMIDQLVTIFAAIRDATNDPALAAQIQLELDTLNPNSFVSLTMDEAMTQIGGRIQGQLFLPIIVHGG